MLKCITATSMVSLLSGLAIGCGSVSIEKETVHTEQALSIQGSGETNACATRQYQVASDGPVRDGPGGSFKFDVYAADYEYSQYFANITEFNGAWYGGNFYKRPWGDSTKYWIGSGWILAEHLRYMHCW